MIFLSLITGFTIILSKSSSRANFGDRSSRDEPNVSFGIIFWSGLIKTLINSALLLLIAFFKILSMFELFLISEYLIP